MELYNPQLVGKISFGEDPCAPAEDGSGLAATFAECARTGVTAGPVRQPVDTPRAQPGQLTQLQGGNPDLLPEEADTYTLGVTFRPEALPGFTGSLDYYHIKTKGAGWRAGGGHHPFATAWTRATPCTAASWCAIPITGTLNGASVQSGGYIVQTNVNIGAGALDGIDLQAVYKFDLGDMGNLRFAMNGAYLLKSDTTPIPGGASYDCAGLFGPTCQTVNPEWRHSLRTSWDLPSSDLTVNLTWRYLGGVKHDNNDSDPDAVRVGAGCAGDLSRDYAGGELPGSGRHVECGATSCRSAPASTICSTRIHRSHR